MIFREVAMWSRGLWGNDHVDFDLYDSICDYGWDAKFGFLFYGVSNYKLLEVVWYVYSVSDKVDDDEDWKSDSIIRI